LFLKTKSGRLLIGPDDLRRRLHRTSSAAQRELSLRLSSTKTDQPDRRSSKALESSGTSMDFVAEWRQPTARLYRIEQGAALSQRGTFDV
jgi:hypothetical protein